MVSSRICVRLSLRESREREEREGREGEIGRTGVEREAEREVKHFVVIDLLSY